jgi:penicillin amidase
LRGLAALNTAGSVAEAGRAARLLTWNENLLVADDAGHIGWWHPGLLPLKPKRWDERLPLPGDGRAEWRGVLPFRALPKVVDPPRGYISNWNNMPSAGWTNGDSPAMERNAGPLHRGAYLDAVVRRVAAAPSFDAVKAIEREVGVTAQQRPLLDAELRAAAQLAETLGSRAVLGAIVAWDGDYDRTDGNGTVDPGVAAFEALKEEAEDTLPAAAVRGRGSGAERREPR